MRPDDGDGIAERNPPSRRVRFDASENLLERWCSCETLKLCLQVVLQRLACVRSAVNQFRVHVFGNIAYEYIGHAYRMQALQGHVKRVDRPKPEELSRSSGAAHRPAYRRPAWTQAGSGQRPCPGACL